MSNDYHNYLEQILGSWENEQREGALKIINKYGYPDEAIPSRLIWYNTGPWKRTIVYRDSVPHNFPTRGTTEVLVKKGHSMDFFYIYNPFYSVG